MCVYIFFCEQRVEKSKCLKKHYYREKSSCVRACVRVCIYYREKSNSVEKNMTFFYKSP